MPWRRLRIRVTDQGAVTVVHLDGEIDLQTAPGLDRRLAALLNAGFTRLVLDLAGVTFCDSTGLGVLVNTARRLRLRHRRLYLAAPSPAIGRILDITGIITVFDLHTDVDTAVAAAAPDESP